LRDGEEHWARGNDYLALQHASGEREIWPYFLADQSCSTCDMRELADPATDTEYQFRVFQPPGYAENTLKRYPVLYLQDGQNMFFRNGGSGGHDWRLEETLTRLADMNAVDKVLAVGVYAANRGRDYSLPGCEAYARFLAHVLKPHIDREFRTLPGPRDTAIMGASLGGVATFYTAWTWPDVFGKAACLSTSFGWRDDLSERVAREAKRDALFYLDSGWPKDNFETTRDMRALLASRGWSEGHDLFYFAFPVAHHDEHSWAMRCHIPIQIMFGRRPPPGPAHREPPTDCSGG
jgi:predicted alpha/beta superfamily hydrolase